jgi:hypothetical protein
MGSGLVKIDDATRVAASIDISQNKTHDGIFYELSYLVADLGGATNDIMSLAFTTPAATAGTVFMTFEAHAAAAARWRVIEGKSGGGGSGTGDKVVYNANRGSSNTSGIISHHGTPATGYLSYDSDIFTGGTSIVDLTLGEVRSAYFVLAASTLYQSSVYLTANTSGSLRLKWFEMTSKA